MEFLSVRWHHTEWPTRLSSSLREVDLEPNPKTRLDQHVETRKKDPRRKQVVYHTAWTQIWMPALTEVDLEPSAKKGANRTKALVNLYWSSQSLYLKELPNQTHTNQPNWVGLKKYLVCNMVFNSQSSSQSSSQELVHYTKQKNETDDNEKEMKNLTISKIEECNVTFFLEGSDYRKKIWYLS